MKEGMFLPQFVAQAVIDMRWLAGRIDTKMVPGASELLKRQNVYDLRHCLTSLADLLLNEAKCFVLPVNGEIYRSNNCGGKMPSQSECENTIGLPAPVCAFEYYWTHEVGEDEWRRRASMKDEELRGGNTGKRITLAIDMAEQCKKHGQQWPVGVRPIVELFSICFEPAINRWMPTAFSMAVPLPLSVRPAPVQDNWGVNCQINETKGRRKVLPTDPRIPIAVGEMKPDLTLLVQVCNSLRAGARIKEHTEQSAMRRTKFASKGAGGIVYHTLVLPGDKYDDAPVPSAATGSHASPKHHFRRGHIRQLSSGTLTWVRHCLVGSRENGEVLKNYQIGGTA